MNTETFVVWFHNGNSFRTALCVKKKVLHLICNDGSIVRHHTRPLTELRDMTILENTTVAKAKKSLRRQGRNFGITKQAKKYLKRGKQ